MPNIKQAFMPYYLPSQSGLYAIVLNVLTGFILDNTDGTFKLSPINSKIPLTEYLPTPSVYYFSESRSVWADGRYSIYAYDITNTLFAGADMFILNDEEVDESDLLSYMELIKNIESGNWTLDATKNTWTYFDEDNITPLMTFNVYDKNGLPSVFNIFKRVRTL